MTGETPSPEMVAAAGEFGGLPPAIAWACLVGIIVSVIAAILMRAQTMLYRRVPLEAPFHLAPQSTSRLPRVWSDPRTVIS
jgi:hypothetical protein